MKDGSLNDIIIEQKSKNKKLTYEKIYFWTIQLLNGIDFLHSKIWHGDIKPANIFLHRNELVLGDLGHSRVEKTGMLTAVK